MKRSACRKKRSTCLKRRSACRRLRSDRRQQRSGRQKTGSTCRKPRSDRWRRPSDRQVRGGTVGENGVTVAGRRVLIGQCEVIAGRSGVTAGKSGVLAGKPQGDGDRARRRACHSTRFPAGETSCIWPAISPGTGGMGSRARRPVPDQTGSRGARRPWAGGRSGCGRRSRICTPPKTSGTTPRHSALLRSVETPSSTR